MRFSRFYIIYYREQNLKLLNPWTRGTARKITEEKEDERRRKMKGELEEKKRRRGGDEEATSTRKKNVRKTMK